MEFVKSHAWINESTLAPRLSRFIVELDRDLVNRFIDRTEKLTNFPQPSLQPIIQWYSSTHSLPLWSQERLELVSLIVRCGPQSPTQLGEWILQKSMGQELQVACSRLKLQQGQLYAFRELTLVLIAGSRVTQCDGFDPCESMSLWLKLLGRLSQFRQSSTFHLDLELHRPLRDWFLHREFAQRFLQHNRDRLTRALKEIAPALSSPLIDDHPFRSPVPLPFDRFIACVRSISRDEIASDRFVISFERESPHSF